jgi:mercuric ion binding protein
MKKFILLFAFCISLFATQKVAVIEVEGMTCPLCTSAIKQSLRTTPGVIKAKVILNTKKATVVFDDSKTNIKQLLHAIEVVGYNGKVIEVKNKN